MAVSANGLHLYGAFLVLRALKALYRVYSVLPSPIRAPVVVAAAILPLGSVSCTGTLWCGQVWWVLNLQPSGCWTAPLPLAPPLPPTTCSAVCPVTAQGHGDWDCSMSTEPPTSQPTTPLLEVTLLSQEVSHPSADQALTYCSDFIIKMQR